MFVRITHSYKFYLRTKKQKMKNKIIFFCIATKHSYKSSKLAGRNGVSRNLTVTSLVDNSAFCKCAMCFLNGGSFSRRRQTDRLLKSTDKKSNNEVSLRSLGTLVAIQKI